jgi:hypothetical protein
VNRLLASGPLLLAALVLAGCPNDSSQCGGCGDNTPPDPTNACSSDAAPADGKPALRAGVVSSTGAFTALVGNETVPLQYGLQGGEHVYISLRLFAPAAKDPWVVTLTLHDPATSATFASNQIAVPTCTTGWSSSDDIPVILNGALVTPATLMVDATPPGGTAIHAEIPIAIKQ